MTARWQGDAQGPQRIRRIAITCGVLAVLVAAGTVAAYAGSDGWWGASHQQRVSRTPAPPSVHPSASMALQPSASPTANPAAIPTPRPGATRTVADTGSQYLLPPAGAGFDYQIGGTYPPPAGVEVVSRDHTDSPAPGRYSICYVNGFQAQTEAADWWRAHHPDLLLTSGGEVVVDHDWNEILLDISTSAKRNALAEIVGGWIDECAAKGFRAVEVDNLDSFSRSNGLLTSDEALAYAGLLVDRVHRRGLAAAQKNSSELARAAKARAGFDFAIAEDCAQYELSPGVPECQAYVNVYGDHVLVIEYSDASFQRACARYSGSLSIVRRDRDVSPAGSSGYVFRLC